MVRRRLGSPVWGLAAAALLLTPFSIAGPGSTDWPQFRGNNRDGVSPETGLAASWPSSGPKEAWRIPIGEGYSGISVVGGHIYTMYAGEHEGEPAEFAAAFDAASGKEIWRTPVGTKFDNQFGNGPRATPTVDGDTAYVLGSVGELAALSIKDGKKSWSINLVEAFESKVPTFGFSSSVLVDNGLVIVETGGPEGKSFAGLDKRTGAVKWTSGTGGNEAGYNSPLAIDLNGKRRYVYVAGQKLRCIDEAGKEVWSHDWPQGETHAMPIFLPPNRLYVSGAEGVGAHLFEIGAKGDSITEIWNNGFMRNHFSSAVVKDGFVYGFDNATLKCISLEDASLSWAKRGLGKGSLVMADGSLFVLSDRGKLVMVKATPDAYVELGSTQALDGRCWTAPTVSGGRLYLRSHTEMVSYELKS